MASVVRIFATISATEHLDRFWTHVLTDKRHYDLHEVLIPDVKAIDKWIPKVPAAQPAASRLLQHCLAELRAATASPSSRRKTGRATPNSAATARTAARSSRFLRDPAQRVGRFPLRKERRQHLHQQIDRHGCDLTHVTERVGSPQTLVCTKTQASYERRLKQFEVDQKLLAELETLASEEGRVAARRSSSRRTVKK